MNNLAVVACVLRATTKNGHQLFEEKEQPRENPGYYYNNNNNYYCYYYYQSSDVSDIATTVTGHLPKFRLQTIAQSSVELVRFNVSLDTFAVK